MLDLEMSAAGLFALVLDGVTPDVIRRFRRAAHKQAFQEWVARRGFPGLGGRFSANNMGILGLSERSPNYVKRVTKKWGKYMPYVSPFRDGKYSHMRDQIPRDSGHRIANKNNTPGTVITVLKLVGARILNRLTGAQAKYRRELLRLSSSYGKADRDWLEKRANEIFLETFNTYVDAQKEKSVRARNRLARLTAAPPAEVA